MGKNRGYPFVKSSISKCVFPSLVISKLDDCLQLRRDSDYFRLSCLDFDVVIDRRNTNATKRPAARTARRGGSEQIRRLAAQAARSPKPDKAALGTRFDAFREYDDDEQED